MPTLISSQFKGPSNTNDGTMVAVMYDGSNVHPSLTCNNAGGGQRMPDKENFNGIIEMETETIHTFENHQTDSRTVEVEVAPCTGASQNGGLANNNPLVSYHYAVRRITPIEGERLQGFADNWTRPCFTPDQITDELVDRFVAIHQNWSAINGKPNAKPKSRKWVRNWLTKISSADCPDGPRYKAIGNSMSVNVMNWIGQVIDINDKETRK